MQSVRVLENIVVGDKLHHIVLETGTTDLPADYTVPGQYVQLTVGDARPAYMAIASGPGTSNFEFLIQSTEGTAGEICAQGVGASLQISTPMGKGFNMALIKNSTPLFFTTGTGISAIRAVIESQDWSNTGARLYYGAFTPADMAYQDRFADWTARGVEVHAVMSEAGDDWPGHRGFVQDIYANDPLEEAANAALVLCGAKIMCEQATALLTAAGMPAENALTNY